MSSAPPAQGAPRPGRPSRVPAPAARALAAAAGLAGACAPAPEAPELAPPRPDAEVALALPGVVAGQLQPTHTCHGEGRSPALSWEARSPDASSAAWLLELRGADGVGRVHWMAWNPEGPEVPEGLHPAASPPVQSWQDAGGFGYLPPCPGPGEVLEGRVILWALSRHLSVPPTASRDEVMTEIAARSQGRAELAFSVGAPREDTP